MQPDRNKGRLTVEAPLVEVMVDQNIQTIESK